jgi:hypothetical protein
MIAMPLLDSSPVCMMNVQPQYHDSSKFQVVEKRFTCRGTIDVNQTGKKQLHARIVQTSACFTAEKHKPQQKKTVMMLCIKVDENNHALQLT